MISSGENLRLAREVLQIQSAALRKTADKLNDQFSEIVEHIKSSPGKVVVTGLGKSGHIARKIAATLSSTGTTACFLHPSEALHGDLGLIAPSDTILAIAFGGETFEVIEVVKFAKRQDLKVVAISGKKNSTLGLLSDYFLDGSVEQESCPHNLAPTTSTTVAIALGDCLAVALMNARGFDSTDFARYHPGGSLGRKLAKVEDQMRPISEILPLKKDDSFHEVIYKVTTNNFGIAAVVSQGELVGAVTDGDLRRALMKHEDKVFKFTAGDLMTPGPKVISAGQPCLKALKIMESHKITSIFVISQENPKELIGLLRLHDLFDAKIV